MSEYAFQKKLNRQSAARLTAAKQKLEDERGWAHTLGDEDDAAENFSHAESPDTWEHKGTGKRGKKGSSAWEKEQEMGGHIEVS